MEYIFRGFYDTLLECRLGRDNAMETNHFFNCRWRENSCGTAIEMCMGAEKVTVFEGEIAEEFVRD